MIHTETHAPEFSELVETLTEKTRSTPALIQTMVELTYGCNLRCVHCYNPTHEVRNELSTTQVFRLLDDLAANGCLWIGFTGGEIFTRRDACEIIARARSLGMMVSLVTNATLITPALADCIETLGPYQVDVSLYGATAETYAAVTGIPGSFAAFVRGIDRLRARKIPMMLKLVMMTVNVHELAEMKKFAEDRKLPYRVGTDIHARVDGNRDPLAVRLSPEQIVQVWRDGGDDRDAAMETVCGGGAGALFDCLCGKSNAAITPQGKMNLCLSIQHPQIDLTQRSVADGWRALTTLVASAKPGASYACTDCGVNKLCSRGAMDGWLEEKKFDSECIPHYREVAERKADVLRHGKTETAATR